MIDWASERESLAENFAGRAESATSYMLSSRASRRLKEEGDEAQQEIEEFKEEIQKRYLMSVANKYYSFPFTELSFDNPIEDQDIQDLTKKTLYCLYEGHDEEMGEDSIEKSRAQKEAEVVKESVAQNTLNDIRNERQKINDILEMINNRKSERNQQRGLSKSKQKRLAYKYGVIREEDEEAMRKRLYTQPYEKPSGFIVKKK